MNKSYKTELENNLSQIIAHPQQKLNDKDKGKIDANTRATHDVLSNRKPKPSA